MNKLIVLMITAFLIIVISPGFVSAQTCAISPGPGHPLLPDFDCDGIVDMEDNCPFITNPMQRDADGNGLGNLCDVYIESITTNPADFVFNGRAFNAYATIYNNREHNLRNVKVRLIMPEIRVESVQYIDNLEVCSAHTAEFFIRAPMCVPMHDYQMIVEVSFMNLYGEYETIPGFRSLRVIPDKYCQMVLDNNQTIGNTFIDVMEIQDVYKGSEAVFPIRVSNREFNGKEYIFSVTGLDGWGNFRLDPGSLIIVPSESDRMMDLYVSAHKDVAPGERVFVVSVQSGEEVQRFLLIANVKEAEVMDQSFLWFFSIKAMLIIGLIILIIVGLVIGIIKYMQSFRNSSRTEYNEYEPADNVQYY